MFSTYTVNEGPVRIRYKCLVPIYVFPEMKMLFTKQNYNVLSPRSYTHISMRDIYISRIDLPILLQGNMWISCKYINRSQTHECGNWYWGSAIPRKGITKWDCAVYNILCSTYLADIEHGPPQIIHMFAEVSSCCVTGIFKLFNQTVNQTVHYE
jgi:hypothetical protein